MIWNLPNILTLLRLCAAPGVAAVFLAFDRPAADALAFALFAAAAATDYFDGRIARLWRQQSRFGAMLDPIADKAMVVIALAVIMASAGHDGWILLPATVILFREVFVSGLREFLGSVAGLLQVTRLAKWKTTVQMVAIGALFLGGSLAGAPGPAAGGGGEAVEVGGAVQAAGLALLWVAAGLTLVTGVDYFLKALPHLRGKAG